MSTEQWPEIGTLTDSFLGSVNFLTDGERSRIAREAKAILAKGTNPHEPDSSSTSVLVVGDVQSGKTLSFTTTLVLGRENGFRLNIVIAGTKRNLRTQTFSRLNQDLRTNTDEPTWAVFSNPSHKLADALIEMLSDSENTKVPVLVVMKTGPSLKKLEVLLTVLKDRLGIIPTLMVDDEADQAGLNVALDKENDASTVYLALRQVREASPKHTFLMYTATSQALTLVSLEDHMSPDYVMLLDSSATYVGAQDLLDENKSRFYARIPSSELMRATSPVPGHKPVKSLKDSLNYFLLAGSLAVYRRNPVPASMLIHPDLLKTVHEIYEAQVDGYISDLIRQLNPKIRLEERLEFFEKEFGTAIRDLGTTVDLSLATASEPSINVFFIKCLEHLLPLIQVRKINSQRDSFDISQDDWRNHPLWILIGAAKMERGYTIEGLIVTYMPRGVGMGITDNVQQRARFFGNKRAYSDLLRGWLSEDTFFFYKKIAEMEALLKIQLRTALESGSKLKLWSRQLILSPGMQPTRKAAIGLQNLYVSQIRGGFRFFQNHLFTKSLSDSVTFRHNYGLVRRAFDLSTTYERDTRRNHVNHKIVRIRLRNLLNIMGDWVMSKADKQNFNGLLLGLSVYLDSHPDAEAVIIFMDSLEIRRRSATKDSSAVELEQIAITNLHQGEDSKTTYLGDRAMYEPNYVTLQIHNVLPVFGDQSYANVLALAVAVPLELQRVVFHQGDMDD